MVKINLSKLLADKNMSQSQLAKLTGIRPSTICEMCNNVSIFLKIDYLERICSALNCDVSDLISIV